MLRKPSFGTLLGLVAALVAVGGAAYAVTQTRSSAPASASTVYYRAPTGTPIETIFEQAGLRLRARCTSNTKIVLTASALTDGSFKAWFRNEGTNVDYDVDDYEMDPGQPPLQVLGPQDGGQQSIGLLTWNTRDRRVLSINFQVESSPYDDPYPGCMLAGTAVSG